MANYTYRAEWSEEHCQYVGRCLEFRGRFATAPTPTQAIERVEQLIDTELAEYAELGMDPPASLSDHRYSGTFSIRTSPVLHRRLTIEAAEQGVSLNQWVFHKLAERPLLSPLDELFG